MFKGRNLRFLKGENTSWEIFERTGFEVREVAPNYWGIVGPDGKTYNFKGTDIELFEYMQSNLLPSEVAKALLRLDNLTK